MTRQQALDISQVHDVVTDAATPAADLAVLKKLGKRVWIAESVRRDMNPQMEESRC